MVKKLNWILLSDLKFTDAFYISIGKCIRIRHIDLSKKYLDIGHDGVYNEF